MNAHEYEAKLLRDAKWQAATLGVVLGLSIALAILIFVEVMK